VREDVCTYIRALGNVRTGKYQHVQGARPLAVCVCCSAVLSAVPQALPLSVSLVLISSYSVRYVPLMTHSILAYAMLQFASDPK
jgi:hypothetical protein